MLDPYLDFLTGLTRGDFLRLFWFFFLLEVPRYLVLDYVALALYAIDRRTNRRAHAEARRKLWIDRPLVSVVVPGKNEGANFYALARTLREQTYDHLELIVVDDGSDDQSALIGRDLERRGVIDLFLRNEVRGGKASAANLGLRYARGAFVLHLDADSSMDREALERVLVPFYVDRDIGAVGGSLSVRNARTNMCTTLQAIEYLITITMGRLATSTLGILRIVSGAFGVFRRDVLEQVGGWDIGPGLDGDLTVKIRKAGYKVHFEPNAVVQTDAPTSFARLARQRLRWQRSLVRFRLRKHSNVFRPGRNFSFLTFLSFVENIFYNIVLNALWYVYMYDVLTNFTSYAAFILITNGLLYMTAKYLQMGAILALVERPREKLHLLPFVPLMVLYTGYYMRVVRTVSYVSEFFFKASYRDPWNPRKTSVTALDHGM